MAGQEPITGSSPTYNATLYIRWSAISRGQPIGTTPEPKDVVRELLKAMREPSEEMRLAAWGECGSADEDIALWQAMIDAELARM
jgi:hypothetical protein